MFRAFLYLNFSLVVLAVGILITVNNGQIVNFDYYFSTISLPLIVLIFIAIIIGAFLSLFLCFIWMFKQHRQLKRSNQSKILVQKELDNLRKLRGEC